MARRPSLLGGGSSSALRALCERPLSSTALRSALRAPLRRLLAFDGYCVNTCDVSSGVVTSSVGDGLSPEQARTLFELEASGQDFNTLSELHRGPARAVSIGQATGGVPERSPRMKLLFLPLGWGDELRAALTVDGACFGYLHLFRRVAQRPFQTPDLKRIEAVVPLIAAALRRAAAGDAARSKANREPGPALLVLDANNELVRQSADPPACLSGLDALSIASGSAHVLQDLASRARSGRSSRATVIRAGAAPRTLSALQLGDQTAVVVDRWHAEEACSLLSSLAGLTARERKVSACIARGDTNQAIAAELGISLHTVKDHVKALLRKTRSASRAELAARFHGARA